MRISIELLCLEPALRLVPRCLFAAVAVVGFSAAPATAENWPQWRGPDFTGVSDASNLPVEWSKTKNVAWRTPLPGAAGATPVVWDDRIFLTSADDTKLLLMCFGTDGKQRWQQTIAVGNKTARSDEGNSASPSPCTDGKHVWAFMGTGDLACFTVDGKPIWQFNVQDRFGKFDIQFGMSSTPVLHDGKLLLQLLHGDGNPATHEATVAALDAATGKTLWKSPRVTGAGQENEHSYASPILYDFDGLTLLVTHGGDYTVAYDPKTGKEVWRLGGLNPHDDPSRPYHTTLRFVASPGVGPGIVVCPTAKNGPVFAVRPDQTGDLTGRAEALLWKLDRNTPDVPSPLVHDGLVYLCRENGVLQCHDARTGEEFYAERTHNQRHRASPVLADGHLYLTARDGKVTVVKTGKTFEMLAQNDTGEDQSASPAVAEGTIYLRTFDALWAIRKP